MSNFVLSPHALQTRWSSHRSIRLSKSWFDDTATSALKRHPAFFLTFSYGLVASHLLLIIFQPAWADGIVYPIIGLAILLCSAVFYLRQCSLSGPASLRWQLFALALAINSLNFMRATAGFFLGQYFGTSNAVLQAIAGVLIILALTLPSFTRSSAEASLDVFIALFFCALRIVYLHALISPRVDPFTLFTHFIFESGIALLLGFVALAASPKGELVFFRSAVIYLLSTIVAGFSTNMIGFFWLHQHDASPWSLTATALRVGVAIYLVHGFARPQPSLVPQAQREILSRLVPLAMSCFLVWLSVELLYPHPALGRLGIAVGVASFVLRTGMTGRHRPNENHFTHTSVR
jgi:hypothetical protein